MVLSNLLSNKRCFRASNSPLQVLEDKLPELEVPQHNTGLVTGSHSGGDLFEEGSGFRFPEVPPRPDVRVQVPVTSGENHIRARPANDDLFDGVNVWVGIEAKVAA